MTYDEWLKIVILDMAGNCHDMILWKLASSFGMSMVSCHGLQVELPRATEVIDDLVKRPDAAGLDAANQSTVALCVNHTYGTALCNPSLFDAVVKLELRSEILRPLLCTHLAGQHGENHLPLPKLLGTCESHPMWGHHFEVVNRLLNHVAKQGII